MQVILVFNFQVLSLAWPFKLLLYPKECLFDGGDLLSSWQFIDV